MRRYIVLKMALGALSLAEAVASAAAQPVSMQPRTGMLTLEPYEFVTHDGTRREAELGRLWVPENRGRADSRLIQIAFVRLKSTAASPGAPIVWLAGGPGTPSIGMARVPVYYSLFERLRAVSDVILLDQRGIGESVPALICAPTPTPADAFASDRRWLATYTRKSQECAQQWRRRGVDLAGYTNDASADDIEDLRRALGAPRISLIGHSYGTFLAQTMIRRHGDRIERAVLAAVVGPDNLIALPDAWDEGLRRISAAAGPGTPDLAALFQRAKARLARSPASLRIAGEGGAERTILVGPAGLEWLVRNGMADPRNYPILRALFESVAAGDNSMFGPRIEALYNLFQGRSPMANAVECSIGWTRQRMTRARRQARTALFDNVNLHWMSDICAAIGVAADNSAATARPGGGMPVLFLSGSIDVNTPPFQAEALRRGFPNSAHIVIENSGHEMLPSRQVQTLVADFFRGENVAGREIRFDPPRFLSVEEARRVPVHIR